MITADFATRVQPGAVSLGHARRDERDQRKLPQALVGRGLADQRERGRPRPADRHDSEIERLLPERIERIRRLDLLDVDVLVARQQRADLLVQLGVLGDQRDPPRRRPGDSLEPAERSLEAGLVDRIVDERNGAGAETVEANRAVSHQRDREVAGVRVLLQLPEHRFEPGQVAGEHDCARAVLAGQAERSARPPREDRLGPPRADGLDHRLGPIGVGVDHEHDPVAALELIDLVRELILDGQHRDAVGELCDLGPRFVGAGVDGSVGGVFDER